MLSKLADIAPLGTWALTLGAAALLLCGFVALGHAKLVHGAYKEPFRGGTSPATLETALRWGTAMIAGGLLLWGLSLHWERAVLAGLGAVTGAVLLLEIVARVRG